MLAKRSDVHLCNQCFKNGLIVPILQKFVNRTGFEFVAPSSILRQTFLMARGEARMSGEQDEFFDFGAVARGELQGETASHRVPDEVRLADPFNGVEEDRVDVFPKGCVAVAREIERKAGVRQVCDDFIPVGGGAQKSMEKKKRCIRLH